MAHIFASERAKPRTTANPSGPHRSPEHVAEQPLDRLQRKADESSATARLMNLQSQPIQRMEEEDMLQGKAIQRMEEEDMLQGKAIQRQEQSGAVSEGGLPAQLQDGIHQLSGTDISGVNVHYNSSEPAAVNAHAFAQGNDIHLASGQEKHLPHEAWHVVQQKQGRVSPTTSVSGTPVNDDPGLETEADVMGAKASQFIARDKSY